MYLRTCAILDAGGLCHYAGTKEYIIDENMEVKTGTDAVELADKWKQEHPVGVMDSVCVTS